LGTWAIGFNENINYDCSAGTITNCRVCIWNQLIKSYDGGITFVSGGNDSRSSVSTLNCGQSNNTGTVYFSASNLEYFTVYQVQCWIKPAIPGHSCGEDTDKANWLITASTDDIWYP